MSEDVSDAFVIRRLVDGWLSLVVSIGSPSQRQKLRHDLHPFARSEVLFTMNGDMPQAAELRPSANLS